MNDLENFLEVALCKTMREAALKLGITQPALSESIKRLETDLKAILFYRSRTGIKLTPNGQSIYSTANRAHSLLSEIESIPDSKVSFGTRVVTIGCHPTVAAYYLPKALKKLETVSPDYKINLKHDLSRNIQAGIQQGLIDIGIVVNPIPSPDLIIKKIGTDEVAIWNAKNGCHDKVFCNLELVQTQSILRQWKDQPITKVNTDSLELIVRLTVAGLGFGIIPEFAVHLLRADLTRVKSSPVFKDTIYLIYRPEFGKAEIEKQVVKVLLDSHLS